MGQDFRDEWVESGGRSRIPNTRLSTDIGLVRDQEVPLGQRVCPGHLRMTICRVKNPRVGVVGIRKNRAHSIVSVDRKEWCDPISGSNVDRKIRSGPHTSNDVMP